MAGDCGDPTDGGCADVPFPHPMNAGNFNVIPENPPKWMPTEPLSAEEIAEIEEFHLERVQMIQSVDDLVGRVLDSLHAAGASDETYVVLTSDNGYHLGEHALRAGKSTAYDHDVRVPLLIRPPGGTDAATVSKLAQNTDLLPTFLEIAEATVPDDIDGKSLLGLVDGENPPGWREGALVSYLKVAGEAARRGPDRITADSPSTFNALRTQDYLYVDHSSLDRKRPKPRMGELYDLRSDPDMIVNLWGDVPKSTRNDLNDELRKMATCEGDQCKRRQRDVPSLD